MLQMMFMPQYPFFPPYMPQQQMVNKENKENEKKSKSGSSKHSHSDSPSYASGTVCAVPFFDRHSGMPGGAWRTP